MVKNIFCLSLVIFQGTTIPFVDLNYTEFLAEGTAIGDLINANKVLIKGKQTLSEQEAIQVLGDVYTYWVELSQILTTNIWPSELSKFTANVFFAQRKFYINAL